MTPAREGLESLPPPTFPTMYHLLMAAYLNGPDEPDWVDEEMAEIESGAAGVAG